MTERLLAIPEVAAQTSTSVGLWRTLVARGRVPAVKIGRLVRIPESAVDAYIRLGFRPSREQGPSRGDRRSIRATVDRPLAITEGASDTPMPTTLRRHTPEGRQEIVAALARLRDYLEQVGDPAATVISERLDRYLG